MVDLEESRLQSSPSSWTSLELLIHFGEKNTLQALRVDCKYMVSVCASSVHKYKWQCWKLEQGSGLRGPTPLFVRRNTEAEDQS